jgi:transcriptional regulator of acetoin/glycerol metabolism
MNQALMTTAPQDSSEQLLPHDDAYLSQVDDEALAHALRTVNWHPKDVSQFLRSAANR